MRRLGTVAIAALGAVAMLPAQSALDGWVTTWTTAQQLIAPSGPPRPAKLKAEADSGDHIHPNDAGNQKMADTFDLGVFQK